MTKGKTLIDKYVGSINLGLIAGSLVMTLVGISINNSLLEIKENYENYSKRLQKI